MAQALHKPGGSTREQPDLTSLLEDKELRSSCVSCRVSVYWEGEETFYRVSADVKLCLAWSMRACQLQLHDKRTGFHAATLP